MSGRPTRADVARVMTDALRALQVYGVRGRRRWPALTPSQARQIRRGETLYRGIDGSDVIVWDAKVWVPEKYFTDPPDDVAGIDGRLMRRIR